MFGGRCAYEPLPLIYNEEFEDPNGIFRYVLTDGLVRFECKPKLIIDVETQAEVQQATDTWRGLYRYNLNPITIEDVKIPFEHHTTSKDNSLFTAGPFMFKSTDTGKVTVTGDLLTVYTSEGNMKELSKRKEVQEADFDNEILLHFGLSKLE